MSTENNFCVYDCIVLTNLVTSKDITVFQKWDLSDFAQCLISGVQIGREEILLIKKNACHARRNTNKS